ncbi:hypothetical protein B5S33_g2537 [[Candida] boidinii]|nr:hypothetical protein B5S33_g2537 [[Candida] boidinii]
MCGRYSLDVSPDALPDKFGEQHLKVDQIERTEHANPRYNIGPAQYAPVYYFTVSGAGDSMDNIKRHIRYMKWGLIPFWTKDLKSFKAYSTFNAKLEAINEGSRLWSTVRSKHRCVVPIQGYYEWLQGATKKPYFIKRKDNKLMYLAGMYSITKFKKEKHHADEDDDDGKEFEFIDSYTIVTGPAPKNMKWLHNRMPVVLEPGSKEFNSWLNPRIQEWTKELSDCLKPFEKDSLTFYPVNPDVGKISSEGEYLTEPYEVKSETSNQVDILSMLSPKKKADRTTDESNAGKDSPVKTGVKTEKSDLANNDFDDSSKSQVKTEESLNGKKIPATHSPSKFSYVSMKSKDSATPASSPSRKRSIPPDGSPKRRKKSTTKDADKHPKLDFFKNVKVEKAQKPKAEK